MSGFISTPTSLNSTHAKYSGRLFCSRATIEIENSLMGHDMMTQSLPVNFSFPPLFPLPVWGVMTYYAIIMARSAMHCQPPHYNITSHRESI